MDDYMLLYFDPCDKMWHDCGGLFETEDAAKKEIAAYQELVPDMETKDFAIVQNDGKSWNKYRPLDLGDQIIYR